MVCVDWSDAKAYVASLAAKTGKPYRLATEAEWEYAARVGTMTARYWGDDRHAACAYANVYDLDGIAGWGEARSTERYSNCRDGYVFTAPVASFLPYAFGIHDMIGNVFEWLEDCFHDSYDGAPADGSAWVAGTCTQRSARGESWSSTPRNLRAGWRERDEPDFRYVGIGFRVSATLQTETNP